MHRTSCDRGLDGGANHIGIAPGTDARTATRTLSGPAGTFGERPRIPRSSDSESTVTSSAESAHPSSAARIAISVAAQDAYAARNIHPGLGAEPPPPTPVTMSVTRADPSVPITLTRKPSSIVAVAGASR